MKKRKTTTHIIVHTSVSTWGTAKDIDDWHKEQGYNEIGYHYVIENGYPTAKSRREGKRDDKRAGLLTPGRPEDVVGAHCVGYNDKSIGVCLIGDVRKYPYEPEQIKSLITFLAIKCKQYSVPVENILGHYETPNGRSHNPPKTCPDLDMNDIRRQVKDLMKQFGWA